MPVNLKELAEFIAEAKKNTYAGERETKTEPDDSRNLDYRKGNYIYKDRYFGSDRFGGEEVVWFREHPIWLMNYFGGIVNRRIDSEKVFAFLKKALSQVHVYAPFRGPSFYREGDFEYLNSSIGDVRRFKGTEEITYKKEIVHKLEYAGGIITE